MSLKCYILLFDNIWNLESCVWMQQILLPVFSSSLIIELLIVKKNGSSEDFWTISTFLSGFRVDFQGISKISYSLLKKKERKGKKKKKKRKEN